MRRKQFEVPVDSMVEFSGILEENEIENSIVGVNEDEEIIIEVEYEADERQPIFELMELLDADESGDDD